MSIDSKVILFGSQARGNVRPDSDWNILIFIDEEKLEVTEHDNYSYPLRELCWKIHPIMYTLKDWLKRNLSFYASPVIMMICTMQ